MHLVGAHERQYKAYWEWSVVSLNAQIQALVHIVVQALIPLG